MRSYALAQLLLASALSLLAAGCESGGDYSAIVSWAINGQLPTPERCAEHGIARGRLVVRTDSGKAVQTLETDCTATVVSPYDDIEFGGFETSRAFRFDVPYRYTVSLVDATGADLAPPHSGPLNDYGDDPVEVPTIDFLQPAGNAARLYGEWSVNDDPNLANAQSCGDIATIQLVVFSALDQDFLNPIPFLDAPCADGKVESQGPALATGWYNILYEGLGPRGNSVYIGEAIEVVVDGSGDILLPRERIVLGRTRASNLVMQNH